MAMQVKAVALVQGSRDFRVCGVQIKLAGPTPNNALPLITPAANGSAVTGIKNKGIRVS